jgi:hypothetical protein
VYCIVNQPGHGRIFHDSRPFPHWSLNTSRQAEQQPAQQRRPGCMATNPALYASRTGTDIVGQVDFSSIAGQVDSSH